MIVRGHGLARVTATGAGSEIGRIGKSLASLDTEAPRLRRETARIVRLSAAGGVAVAAMVVVLYGVTRGNWIEAVLAGTATAMTLLPEEFPVVLTVFMAMGAWRIGQVGVLTLVDGQGMWLVHGACGRRRRLGPTIAAMNGENGNAKRRFGYRERATALGKLSTTVE